MNSTHNFNNAQKENSDKTFSKNHELKGILDVLQTKTFKFILYFSCSGILIIFALSIFNNAKNPYYELANAMNMFISIVVGIVAMVMSIISLFFSFYNTKQSYDTHDDYLEKFININNSLNQTMQRQEEYIQNINKLSDKLGLLEEKISSKFEKMYDMINALEKSSFTQVKPQQSAWIPNMDESDWDFDNSFENNE